MPTAVALSQLVDLALGSPEVGAVNFNVLHTLLHAMIQKLNLQDVKADIDEHDRELLSSHGIPRAFSAFSVDSGYSKGEDSFSLSEDNLSEKSSSHGAPHKKSPYHRLEKQVSELMKQMEDLNKLPSNEELMGKAKGKESERPVADMWQYMQLKSRVDANEEGVGKLMSLVEDLMKDMRDLKDSQKALMDKVSNINLDDIYKRLNDMDNLFKDLEDKYKKLDTKVGSLPTFEDVDQYLSTFVTWPGLEDALKGIRLDFENMQPVSEERVVIDLGTQTETPKRRTPDQIQRPNSVDVYGFGKRQSPEIKESRVEDQKRRTPEPKNQSVDILPDTFGDEPKSRPPSGRPTSRASSVHSSGPSNELLDILERLGKLASSHEALEKRVAELERLMELKANKTDLEGLGGGNVDVPEDLLATLNSLQEELKALQEGQLKDSAAIKRLQDALQKLQKDLENLRGAIDNLTSENTERIKEIKDLNEQCATLDKNKADKQYVDMEVDVKADRRQLESKVNHSLFDTTTNELNRMIKDILDKLNGHEEGWKSALAKAMEELDGKLDRMELRNLKDWLEKQLKAINNKIKTMGPGYQLDDEAAGMKKQLIQRFNCLSCDKPVDVMPQGPIPSIPGNYGLPRSKSPRPYTTFELDQIRQHARRLYNGMNKSTGSMISLGMSPELADYYAQARQCGGQHTMTYPNKRTTKLNNLGQIFREEETILPLYKDEIDVQGADGHIYKGRMETARLEAKLPVNLTSKHSHPVYMEPKAPSPQPPNRPVSARVPRPGSARPTSSASQQQPRAQTAVPMTSEDNTTEVLVPQNSQIGGSRATTPMQEEAVAEVAVDLVAVENQVQEEEPADGRADQGDNAQEEQRQAQE